MHITTSCSTANISRQTRRPLLSIVLLSVILLSAVGTCRAAYNLWTSEYTFPQQALQTAIATQFPRQMRYLQMFEVTLSNPHLSLNPGSNRLLTTVDIQINNPLLLQKPVTGSLSMSSALKYDAATRAVRLDAPAVEKIDISGVPAQFAPQLNAVGNAAAEQVLKNYPIYTFKPEQLEMDGKHFEPGAITVLDDGIKVDIKPM